MRVTYLVDGYNLYHSIKELRKKLGHEARWLDLKSLFSSYLHLMGKTAKLESIYFFTALRKHLQQTKPDSIQRHLDYLKTLKNNGVLITYGRFKSKKVFCTKCHRYFKKNEEKETDVAIATKLFELAQQNASEVYVIVTGDTDICPAIKVAKKLYPDIKIYSLFPFARKNDELIKYIDGFFTIKAKNYLNHQLPYSVILSDGTKITRPEKWES